MSEQFQIFIFTTLITLFSLITGTTITTWSQFKSTDKDKRANITLLIGTVLIILYLTIIIIILFSGSLIQLLQALLSLLYKNTNVAFLLLWTAIIYLVPKIINKVTQKIIKSSTHLSTAEVTPTRRRLQRQVNVNRNFFSDKLTTHLSRWTIISGSPLITPLRGFRLPKSLLFDKSSTPRNSFVIAKGIEAVNAKVECDAFLENGAVLNIAFRINNDASEFYMARVDSRSNGSNGILISKLSTNWGYIEQTNTYVPTNQWVHIELSFQDSNIELKINNETISKEDSTIFTAGSIGLFNEVERVFINNFTIRKLS